MGARLLEISRRTEEIIPMNDLWKPVFALAAAIWLGACADNPAQPVCGEGGVGFMVQRWPVNGLDVHQVLAELGSNYVVVDPSCRFTVYDATDGHIGAAVEGQLTDDQAAELSAFLALQEWEGLEDFYGLTVCDGSNFRFAWGDRTLALAPACGATAEQPEAFRHQLTTLSRDLASRLRPLGEPVSGPVRYLLGRGNESPLVDAGFEGAPAWPLEIPPESVLLDQGEPGPLGLIVQTADGEDARRLRALRTALLDGEFGVSHASFTPIVQPDGSRYALNVRDVVEFETADGEPFVPWANFETSVAGD